MWCIKPKKYFLVIVLNKIVYKYIDFAVNRLIILQLNKSYKKDL